MIVLSKGQRSVTPLKAGQGSRGARNDLPFTSREKALMKQVAELRRENAELLKLFKKSKEPGQDELGKSRSENQQLKKLLRDLWPLLDGRVDCGVCEQVRSFIDVRSSKTYTLTTNNTEHAPAELVADHEVAVPPRLSEPQPHQTPENALLQAELTAKEAQYLAIVSKLNTILDERDTIRQYYQYKLRCGDICRGVHGVRERPKPECEEVLPVDSANVGSDADEEDTILQELLSEPTAQPPPIIPGFLKSLVITTQSQ